MAKVLITEDYLSDIGDAIRGKLGGSTHYTPGQMASAISSIPTVDPTLISKSISANGTYNADDDNADGYSSVSVSVPNSYSASDEGKVVSSGELVAQTSRNVTVNGTYDTTTNNEVVVNVSGGGGGGSSDAFMTADFTKGSFSFGNVDYGSTGAIFNGVSDWIPLILPKKNDVTVEIDVAMMQLTSGSHRRFIMGTSSEGLIYRSNGKWSFYASGWEETEITDGSYFNGTTVGVYIDTNNYWHIYKDGNLVYEPTSALALDLVFYAGILLIGSNNSQTINNARITGARAYLGNYYGQ